MSSGHLLLKPMNFWTNVIFHVLLVLLLMGLLITTVTGSPNIGRKRCNGVKVLTTDGRESHMVSCLPNCSANHNCTWRKLLLSGNQQPPQESTLRWNPRVNPKGQYVCIQEDGVPVEELLIISESGKHL